MKEVECLFRKILVHCPPPYNSEVPTHDRFHFSYFRSGNCSVERIPLTSPDSELVEASHVRLKHAKELLDVDPTQFMYSGEVSEFSLHASDASYTSQWIIQNK